MGPWSTASAWRTSASAARATWTATARWVEATSVWCFTSLGTFHQDNPIEPEAQDADDEAGEAPQPLGMAPAN